MKKGSTPVPPGGKKRLTTKQSVLEGYKYFPISDNAAMAILRWMAGRR